MASIAEFIKNIRNARLGKDVRESIASAIEQTYEDASKDGNANMEVSEARGTFGNLSQRLNNSDVEIANEITIRKNIDKNLQTQINGLTSGNPLVASSVSEMTDTSKLYVNTSDGYVYYYENEWKKGIQYQSTGIAEKSITTNLIDIIDVSKITHNNYYIKNIQNIGTLSKNCNEKIITYHADEGVKIPGTNFAGFEMKIPIKANMGSLFALFECVGNQADMLVFLPEINYTRLDVVKTNNYYTVYKENDNIINYLNNHNGEYLTLRICFTNNSGIDVAVTPKFINYTKNMIYDNNKFIKLSKPSLKTPYYNASVYNYDDNNQKLSFKFVTGNGLLYNISNIDKTKDLFIKCNLLEGNNIDIFFNWKDENEEWHYYTDNSQTISLSNNVRKISKEYLQQNNITEAEIVFSTLDTGINVNNPYYAIIEFPYVLQFPYSNNLTEAFNQIKKEINYSNNLYNKHLSVLGDSMAFGHTVPRNEVWDSLIASRNNMNLFNIAQNGKFFTRNQYKNNQAVPYTQEELDNGEVNNKCVIDTIPEVTGNQDYIVVFAGTNDMIKSVELGQLGDNNYNTFYGAVYKTCLNLINKFPVANILFITPYARLQFFNYDSTYIQAIIDTCRLFGIPVYDSRTAGLCIKNENQKQALMIDDVHLNALGHERASFKYQSQLMLL